MPALTLMKYLKFFLLMITASLSRRPWLYPENVIEHSYIADAISSIVRSRSSTDTFVLNLIYTANEYRYHSKQQQILTDVLENTRELATNRVTGLDQIEYDESGSIKIFLVATSESFIEVTSLMENGTINTYGFNLFVLTEHMNKPYQLFEAVSARLFKLSTIKVAFLLSRENDSKIVDMITFLPFSEKQCHTAQLMHLNYFENGKFQLKDLRLNEELHNFYGCPLDALLLPYAPYMIQTETSKLEDMDGIDITILRILMEHLNFTLRYNTRANSYERGDIFLNGTATGVMKMIMESKVHFVMGGVLWSKPRNMHLSPSLSYDSFELCLAVPVGRPYTGFEHLLMPFRTDVWIILSLIFVFSLTAPTFCATFLARHTKYRGEKIEFASVFTMTCAWFESPLSRIPRQNSLRFLLNFVLFGLLILRTAYKGSLYDHLQEKRLRTPSTIKEYVDNGFDVITIPFFKQVLANIGFPEEQQRKMTDYNIIEDLFKLGDDSGARYIVILSRRSINFFNSVNWSRSLLPSYPERVYSAPISIFFTKNSYLKATFDREIMNMLSSGITENIVSRYSNRSAVKSTKVFEKYTVHHLSGCFELFGFMLGISMVCFICEIIVG